MLFIKKYGSYHAFLKKADQKEYKVDFTATQEKILRSISMGLANGKRYEELLILNRLLHGVEGAKVNVDELVSNRSEGRRVILASAIRALTGEFNPKADPSLVVRNGKFLAFNFGMLEALRDEEFRRQVIEVVEFGLSRHASLYCERYKDTAFTLNAKYTYEEACRLLGWEKAPNYQNISGYIYYAPTNVFPVFINYDKAPDISDTIKYEDRFTSDRTLIAISKKKRYLSSPEIKRLMECPGNGMKVYLFIRKNTEDKGGKEFYFLGEMTPTGHFSPTVTKANESVVEIGYELDIPVRRDIYEYITSVFVEGDEA